MALRRGGAAPETQIEPEPETTTVTAGEFAPLDELPSVIQKRLSVANLSLVPSRASYRRDITTKTAALPDGDVEVVSVRVRHELVAVFDHMVLHAHTVEERTGGDRDGAEEARAVVEAYPRTDVTHVRFEAGEAFIKVGREQWTVFPDVAGTLLQAPVLPTSPAS